MDKERRLHKRLEIKRPVLCQSVGIRGGGTFTGNSVDVSPGGMLVEFNSEGLCDGQLISIEMSVPPTEGLLREGGRLSNYARVVRLEEASAGVKPDSSSLVQKAALEFC